MLNTQEIFSFVAVAKAGSFTKASKDTGLPKSTLSRHVQNLEGRLALNLFQRTTRKLELTPAGQDFLLHSKSLINEFENLEHNFRSQSPTIEGPLRITCPVEVGICLLPPILKSFREKYPKVEVQLVLEDARLDLIDHRIDVALRGGILNDSSMKVKKFADSCFRLYCGPSYMKDHPELNSPKDIRKAHFIEYVTKPFSKVEFQNGKKSFSISPTSCTQTNSLRMCMELAAQNLGVCLLPQFMGQHESQQRRLTPVLPEWLSEPGPLNIVYPAQRQLSRKLRAFIDHLTV